MANRRYPPADGPSRLACRTRSDALNARRHELALRDFVAACQADDVEAALDAVSRLDMSVVNLIRQAHEDGLL